MLRVEMNWVAFSCEEEEATAVIWWDMSGALRALGSLRRSRTNADGIVRLDFKLCFLGLGLEGYSVLVAIQPVAVELVSFLV
jgi:hypothetical protein